MIAPVEPQATEAWIAPNGDFYAVEEYGHAKWAYNYFTERGFDHYAAWEGSQTLERQHWIHLSGGHVYHRGVKNLTAAQADTLFATLAAYRNSAPGTRYAYRAEELEREIRNFMNEEE